VHASWGVFFRREASLTYARIQDIHLKRNILERWLGIGRVQVQTASGSGSAELVIEGMMDFLAVRDFLYAKMRGATTKPARASHPTSDEAVKLLVEIRDDLRAVRELLAKRDEAPRV
jgi:putative membrane protein